MRRQTVQNIIWSIIIGMMVMQAVGFRMNKARQVEILYEIRQVWKALPGKEVVVVKDFKVAPAYDHYADSVNSSIGINVSDSSKLSSYFFSNKIRRVYPAHDWFYNERHKLTHENTILSILAEWKEYEAHFDTIKHSGYAKPWVHTFMGWLESKYIGEKYEQEK